MLKSPEQYFSEMDFSLATTDESERLNSGERAFIQKYLGEETLAQLRSLEPAPLLKPVRARPARKPGFAEPPVAPKLEVAPVKPVVIAAPTSEIAPQKAEAKPEAAERTIAARPVETIAEVKGEVKTAERTPEIVVASAQIPEKIASPAPVAESAPEQIGAAVATETDAPAPAETIAAEAEKIVAPAVASAATETGAEILPSLKDRLKLENEIQLVSFFVAGQLFLIPVAAIQEVLRHMELVKVPQAPPFIAGVINLRGRVTPLVHLSSLLANVEAPAYDEKNFVIICGSDNLQLGLIIDKISGMHLLPQDKFIWNAESKLGEAAEFLLALANLDDRVCGVVAPEAITQKILAPD